jgi:SAM-dependent methyltransferase
MPSRGTPWTFYCGGCDYWASTLEPVSALVEQGAFPNDGETGDGNPIGYLDDVRVANFDRIVAEIGRASRTRPLRLLEVGCGPGLFLERARRAGIEAQGIEVYEEIARPGIARGLPIRIGMFPDCVADHERFDAIAFNDVFEHLPNPGAVLDVCRRILAPDGLVVLNLPNSHGLFFKVARQALGCGVLGPWDRMWQKGFFTPHLHYFSAGSLERLCRRHGFAPAIAPLHLRSTSLRGLWRRIRVSDAFGIPAAATYYGGAVACHFLSGMFESDCILTIMRKTAPLA